MKALSIQQPWATLLCCGIKDVENRKWSLKSLPLRVLIHAGARRQPFNNDNFPFPYYWEIENYQTMGILPSVDKFPTSAIVGVATIDRCERGNTSMWAQRGNGAEYQWVVTDAKLFKQPIIGVKGSLGIFDIPNIDENNLPEFIEIPKIRRDRTTIFLPIAFEIFNQIKNRETDCIFLNLTNYNVHFFFLNDEECNPIKTEHIVLECNGETIRRKLAEFDIYPVMNPDDTEEIFSAFDECGKEYVWYEILFKVDSH